MTTRDGDERDLTRDLETFALDVIALLDTTGKTDLARGSRSVWDGDWIEPRMSFASIFQGLGEITAHGKLKKYADSIDAAVDLAKREAEFAAEIDAPLRALKGLFYRLDPEVAPKSFRYDGRRIKARLLAHGDVVPPYKPVVPPKSREKVVVCTSLEQARNQAVKFLADEGVAFGPHSRPHQGKLGIGKHAFVGVSSTSERWWQIRIDYDPVKGPHFNVELDHGRHARIVAYMFPPPARVEPQAWIQQLVHRMGDMRKRTT